MENFDHYLQKYELKPSHIYLLELIPIIEMIWADGKNQENELKLLYRFTVEHLSRVTSGSEGIEVISEDDINEFIDRFVNHPPASEMLADLRQCCIEKLERKNFEDRQQTTSAILDYCMDVAAACVSSYPYKFDERVVKKEKELLAELFSILRPQ